MIANTCSSWIKALGMQQIQEQVQLKLRQEQHVDQHQQIRDSSRAPSRDSKRRQSSLTEFIK